MFMVYLHLISLHATDVVVTFGVVPNPPLYALIAAPGFAGGHSQVSNVHAAQV